MKKYGHIFPILLMLPVFIYIMYVNLVVASKKVKIQSQGLDSYFYFTSVEITPELLALAKELKTVQACLDYVTTIPYKVHNFRARQPKDTIERNYGDCDDKSNLLSSLLSALGYENYIVLVPKHAFVIVNIHQRLKGKKALYFNDKAFYILETTAKNSKVGYNLRYKTKQIRAIVNPLDKALVPYEGIRYY